MSGAAREGERPWPLQLLGWRERLLLVVPVASLAATLLVTWKLWQFRASPPNLPWTEQPAWWEAAPGLDWGPALLLALSLPLLWPHRWSLLPWGIVLGGAILQDQMRLQPQVVGLTMLVAAVLIPRWRRCARWYVLSMWLWAGLHKLLSPDWQGPVMYSMLESNPVLQFHHEGIAIGIGLAEVALAFMAWRWPRLGIVGCLGLHLGITIWLLTIDWNQSVVPWNLSLAIVGSWLLWNARPGPPGEPTENPGPDLSASPAVWEFAVLAIWLIVPAGFYLGWVRHSLAHVLYSDNFPIAAVTFHGEVERVQAIAELGVPFPHTQAAQKIYLVRNGAPGDKLHIREPRFAPTNQFFQVDPAGRLKRISREQFFSEAPGQAMGIAIDDPRGRLQLVLGGVELLVRDEKSMIYAARFHSRYFETELLDELAGLLNLEQIQLADCPVSNGDLSRIPELPRLTGLGLAGTDISDAGLEYLARQPRLNRLQVERTGVSEAGLQRFWELRGAGDSPQRRSAKSPETP